MSNLKDGMKRLAQVVLVCLAGGCSAAVTQPGDAQLVKGKAVFEAHCLVCHGPSGRGDGYPFLKPPPADLSEAGRKTDGELLKTIRDGHSGTAMGAWRVALTDEESRNVLAYVRTLQR
jgi:mono/diheme cytochrome c family protein